MHWIMVKPRVQKYFLEFPIDWKKPDLDRRLNQGTRGEKAFLLTLYGDFKSWKSRNFCNIFSFWFRICYKSGHCKQGSGARFFKNLLLPRFSARAFFFLDLEPLRRRSVTSYSIVFCSYQFSASNGIKHDYIWLGP